MGTQSKNIFVRIFRFYVDGFREMTIGKVLWSIILIKLFVFFVILKFLFFPNVLNSNFDNDADRADHVLHEITHPVTNNNSNNIK